MIRDRSSGNASADENRIYAAETSSLLAEGITLEQLNQLIAECEQLDSSQYEEEQLACFYEQLSIAKSLQQLIRKTTEIRDMYHALEEAKCADHADRSDRSGQCCLRRPVRSNLSSADAEGQ